MAGVAFLPYAFYVLAAAKFFKAVAVGIAALVATLGPLALVDRLFYNKWAVSMLSGLQRHLSFAARSMLQGS